jgi:hypothetical protein
MSKKDYSFKEGIRRELKSARKEGQDILEVSITTGDGGPWMKDDREWFESNPECSFRLRRIYQGEFDRPYSLYSGPDFCIVHQTQPGHRHKKAGFTGPLDLTQDQLATLWESGFIPY